MTLRRHTLALFTLLLALPLAATAQAPTKIRVGVEGNYPPFSRMGADGKLSGFDIDMANALCAQMKIECTLVQQEWDGMMPALNAKKFDMIVASMTITDERKKAADFSDPYYNKDSEVLLVNKETDVYMELLAGRGDIGFGSSVVSGEAFLKKPEGKAFAQIGPAVNLDGGSGVGIGFRRGDDALRERVNAALKAIRASGQYKKMADSYFDFDVTPN